MPREHKKNRSSEALCIDVVFADMALASIDALSDLVDKHFGDPRFNILRATALLEMIERTHGTHPETPALVWQVVFGDERPAPVGFQSPSNAHPSRVKRRVEFERFACSASAKQLLGG